MVFTANIEVCGKELELEYDAQPGPTPLDHRGPYITLFRVRRPGKKWEYFSGFVTPIEDVIEDYIREHHEEWNT